MRDHEPVSRLQGQQVSDAGLTGWANLLGGLQTRVVTPDFATGLALVNAIAAAAQELDHHPDLHLRHNLLGVRLTSHDPGGITARDLRLARRISTLVAEAGLELGSEGLTRVELGLDSPAAATIAPFWAAVLALAPPAHDADELPDPSGSAPTVWFQPSGADETRQRWHPDLWVDPGDVRPRIDAALAAGGTLISEAEAPAFWVLADPEGNRVCLCTWQDRD